MQWTARSVPEFSGELSIDTSCVNGTPSHVLFGGVSERAGVVHGEPEVSGGKCMPWKECQRRKMHGASPGFLECRQSIQAMRIALYRMLCSAAHQSVQEPPSANWKLLVGMYATGMYGRGTSELGRVESCGCVNTHPMYLGVLQAATSIVGQRGVHRATQNDVGL